MYFNLGLLHHDCIELPIMFVSSPVLEAVIGKVLAVADHAIHFTFRLQSPSFQDYFSILNTVDMYPLAHQSDENPLTSHEGNEETAVLTPGRTYISGSTNLLSQAPTRSLLR